MSDTYDFAKADDLARFAVVLRGALEAARIKSFAPTIYAAGFETIRTVGAHELTDIVVQSLRREVEGRNEYSRVLRAVTP